MPVVKGLDGAWVCPPAVARVFAPVLRAHIGRALRDGFRVDPVLLAELEAAEESARHRRNLDANPDASSAEPERPAKVEPMAGAVRGLRRAAAIIGCSPSAVHERVRRGTLPFEVDSGVYIFRRENLQKGRSRGRISA